jgi:hypothetical protein
VEEEWVGEMKMTRRREGGLGRRERVIEKENRE